MIRKSSVCTLPLLALIALSCEGLFPDAPAGDQLLDGPVEGLSPSQHDAFLKGDAAFNNEIFSSLNGLGPTFVATSCGSCHPGDGKGHPFTTLTRFGQTSAAGNQFLQKGGPQLQNRALPGFEIEVIPPGATAARFTPPANTGLGFLEAVPDEVLLAMTDPADTDGDGISGEVNWIELPDFIASPSDHISDEQGRYIGRFGKKAAAFNLLHQTVNAYIEDMGITTPYHPLELLHGKTGERLNDNVADPEVQQLTVDNVVFYLKTLKAPTARNQTDDDVLSGKKIFSEIGCEQCHKATLKTGFSVIEPLSYREFHPYTDLLLHDMGSALDDGYTEGTARTSEWRTPALWGLGLSRNSQGGEYFLLHDGRARSIESAILLHGGEGSASRDKFEGLSDSDKQKLIQFLETL